MSAIINIKDVSRNYVRGAETVHALRSLDLDIPSGEFVVLMGSSGSGKSTLLHLIAGFDHPDAGEIHIGKHRQMGKLLPGQIGFVFQNFRLCPLLTASENVQLALLPIEKSTKKRKRRAGQALADVGLADRANHLPSQLSGGEQQRVSIARALVTHPEVILADEPTANLDSETAKTIMDLLKTEAAKTKCTVIVATHDPIWADMATRRIAMKDGSLL